MLWKSQNKKYAEIMAQYLRLRPVLKEIHHQLVRQLSKALILACAKKLGLSRRKALVFDNTNEVDILMDYALYSHRVKNKTKVERYLDQTLPKIDRDTAFLREAMKKSRYSIFEVINVHKDVGVDMLDILRGDIMLLIDRGLGSTAIVGFCLAGRILQCEGWFMTTGTMLPVTRDYGEDTKNNLESILERTLESDPPQLSGMDDTKLATFIIRECLEAKVSSNIEYSD